MSTAIGLEVGPVRECDLDLEQNLALARIRVGNVLEPEIARAVQDQRPHPGTRLNGVTTGSSLPG
jgi:hypothetical protein